MTRKPIIAKPARQPAIPPTTAAVLTEPEELAVEEGVADVTVPVLMTILVGVVNMEVVCEVTAAAGFVDRTVCGTKVKGVDEVEVVEEMVGVDEDVGDEEVIEEEEVVGAMEAEDCWVEVATGVVEVRVGVTAGAEVVPGVSDFCAAEVCALVAAEVETDAGKVGLKRAAKRTWLRLSKS